MLLVPPSIQEAPGTFAVLALALIYAVLVPSQHLICPAARTILECSLHYLAVTQRLDRSTTSCSYRRQPWVSFSLPFFSVWPSLSPIGFTGHV